MLALWLLAGALAGDVALPAYREAVVQRHWQQANQRIESACRTVIAGQTVCEPEPLRDALTQLTEVERHLTVDARLLYLAGLAHRSLGERALAERKFQQSTALDPDRQDAWHDLGELYLLDGRYPEALNAFGHVTRLVNTGTHAWLGPWRQAEAAAHLRDIDAFERHLRLALRRGFSFRMIEGLPNWQSFYADPVVRPSINKLVTAFGDPSTLETLEAN